MLKANTFPSAVDPIRQRIVCYHAASIRLMLSFFVDTNISFGFGFNSGFGFDIRTNFGFNLSFRFDFGFTKTQLTRPLFPQQKRLLFSDIILISLLYHSFIACQAFSKKQICPTGRNALQNAAIRQIKSDKSFVNFTINPSLIELAVPAYSLSSKLAKSICPFNDTPLRRLSHQNHLRLPHQKRLRLHRVSYRIDFFCHKDYNQIRKKLTTLVSRIYRPLEYCKTPKFYKPLKDCKTPGCCEPPEDCRMLEHCRLIKILQSAGILRAARAASRLNA